MVLQLGIWLFSMIYQSIGNSLHIQPRPFIGPQSNYLFMSNFCLLGFQILKFNNSFFLDEAVAVIDPELSEEIDADSGDRAERDYCWPAFHFMMSLSCLYFSMTITDFST